MSFTAPRRVLRRHRLTQVGALGAGLVLLLTACGGGSEPAESSSPAPAGSSSSPAEATTASPSGESSPTTSPSGSVGSTAAAGSSGSGGAYVPASAEGPAQNVPKPEMPAVMKEETQEGAEAAVEYFWEAMYYAERTGDVEVYRESYSQYCEFCSLTSSSMEQIYDDGGWFTGTSPRNQSMILRPSASGYIGTLLVDSQSATGYLASGDVAPGSETPAEEKMPWIVELSFDAIRGMWTVDEMSYEGSR
ncbi:DUF6318 family protein [Micrococcus endophyticus]